MCCHGLPRSYEERYILQSASILERAQCTSVVQCLTTCTGHTPPHQIFLKVDVDKLLFKEILQSSKIGISSKNRKIVTVLSNFGLELNEICVLQISETYSQSTIFTVAILL